MLSLGLSGTVAIGSTASASSTYKLYVSGGTSGAIYGNTTSGYAVAGNATNGYGVG